MKEEEKRQYQPIDYRVTDNLNSIKYKSKTNYNKIFYPLLVICLVTSFIAMILQSSKNRDLEMQIEASTHSIDSLNSLIFSKSSMHLDNPEWLEINNISKKIKFENQVLKKEN